MTVEVQDAIQSLDQFDKDLKFVDDNRSRWIDEQPNRWIVVYDEQLVCSADTYQEAFDEAVANGVIPSVMVIEYITDEPRTLIL